MKLYKYLPEQYVNEVLSGNILFRNLIYFKKIEDAARQDLFEGMHVDKPDNDISITVLDTGKKISGKFAFHNALKNMDKVFCFCMTTEQNPLLKKFGGACVEIDAIKLIQRLKTALNKQRYSLMIGDKYPLLLHKNVSYYKKNAAIEINIKDPYNIPFLKQDTFEEEKEYRFVFARRKGLELEQRIVNDLYSELDDIKDKKEASKIVRIGSIIDIAKVI